MKSYNIQLNNLTLLLVCFISLDDKDALSFSPGVATLGGFEEIFQ